MKTIINQFLKSNRNNRQSQSLSMEIESLEDRKMLAGDVTVNLTAAGDVVLTGDNADNEVSIIRESSGEIEVIGSGGTNIIFEGVSDSSHVLSVSTAADGTTPEISRDLRVNLRGGDDRLDINGLDVGRNATVSLGSGADLVDLDEVGIGGNFTFRGNSGNAADIATISDSNIEGNVVLSFGSASSDFDGAGIFRTQIGGDFRMNQGSGSSLLFAKDTSVIGKTNLGFGSGQDLIDADNFTMVGEARINLGSGDNQAVFENSFGGEGLDVVSGAGSDMVSFDGGNGYAGLDIRSGGGDDSIEINNVFVNGDLAIGMGGGDDTVDLASGNVFAGAALFNGGAGNDFVGNIRFGDFAEAPTFPSVESRSVL